MQSQRLRLEGTPGPACPCPAPWGSPYPAHGPRPHVILPGRQPLPQGCHSRACLQLPTTLPCPAMGPAELGPPVGPHPGLALTCPHPQGGAQGWGCPAPMAAWLRGVSVLAPISPSIIFRSTDLALLKFGVSFTRPRKWRRQYAGSCCKNRGSVVFFFPPFPNC